MIEIPFYRRIRFKLTAAFISLVVVVLLLSGFISFRASERQFENLLVQEFRSTKNIADNFLVFVGQTALITARSVAEDTELQALLTERVPIDQVETRLRTLRETSTADALILIDHEGHIVARGDSAGGIGDSLTYFGIVRDTISTGAPCTAIVQDMETFVLYGSSPVGLSGEADSRIVLAGFELNNEFVDHVQLNTQIDISLIRERSIIATTLRLQGERITTIPIPYLEYTMILANSDRILEADLLGRRFFVTAARMPGMQENMAGSMLLAHSTEELDAVKQSLAVQLGMIFLGSLGVISVLVYISSGSVLRPVRKLTEATDRISSGELPSHIEINSNDEFGILAADFNRMVEKLVEKDEKLRAYSSGLKFQVTARTAEIERQAVLIDNILQSSQELGIAATTMDMEITYFNPAAEKILGFAADDVIGKTLEDVHPGDRVDAGRFRQVIAEVQSNGFASFEIKRKIDDQPQDLDVLVSAMRDKSGVSTGFVFMVRDLTERRRMERRIQEGEKFEAFTMLAGGLAHDLNNLLQVILGHVSLAVNDAPAQSDCAGELHAAEEAIQQASELGWRLLVLSRSELGQTRHSMNVRPILQEEVERIANENIRCELALDDDLWAIDGNPELLREVFRCLIENAGEAMAPGGRLMIAGHNHGAVSESGESLDGIDRIRISFSDTGKGISEEHLGRIFDPYFSTKEMGAQKGMGLSLSATRAIVNKHGGKIEVETEVGVGSTFVVWLPVS